MDIIIVGAFSEIIELIELADFNIVGIFDNNIKNEYSGYPILGDDEFAKLKSSNYCKYPIVISPDLPGIRKRLHAYYKACGYKFCKIISPLATVSKSATIGDGSIIQSNVNLSANSNVGEFVKLNSFSNVMHDVNIQNYTTVAPNAVILGKVNIGSNTYIGANSTILPYVSIGYNVIIAAGAVVSKDVNDNIVSVGNPSKFLKFNNGTF